MKAFATFIHKELGLEGDGEDIKDICAGTDRYCMFKTGPVLSISVSMQWLSDSRSSQARGQSGNFLNTVLSPLLCIFAQSAKCPGMTFHSALLKVLRAEHSI